MTKPPGKLVLVATASLLCLIWGTTWAMIKVGLTGIPPFAGVSIRFGIAAVLLWGLALAKGLKLGRNRSERLLWVINGLLSFSASYGLVYWAEQWVPSGLAAVLFATYPLFVALMAHFTLPGEALSPLEVFGIIFGFAGVGVIFSEDFSALGGSQVAFASGVMLLSPVVSAIASVAVKRWGAGVHPYSITAVPMALTAVVMGAVSALFERDRSLNLDFASVGALLYLAVFGSAVTFTLYFWLLQHLQAKRVALIAFVIPLVAVGVGTLRGEPVTWRTLLGGVLVIGGVALATQFASRFRRNGSTGTETGEGADLTAAKVGPSTE